MDVLDLNEQVVKAVLARLENRLGDYIDEVNAGVSDGYEIEPPAVIFPSIPNIGLLTQWPSIGIQDVSANLEDDIGWAATGVCDLAVLAFLVDPDTIALGWKLRRYSRALASCLLEGRQLTEGGVWGVTFQGVRPGPTLGDAEDPEGVRTYTSWIGVLIRTRSDE